MQFKIITCFTDFPALFLHNQSCISEHTTINLSILKFTEQYSLISTCLPFWETINSTLILNCIFQQLAFMIKHHRKQHSSWILQSVAVIGHSCQHWAHNPRTNHRKDRKCSYSDILVVFSTYLPVLKSWISRKSIPIDMIALQVTAFLLPCPQNCTEQQRSPRLAPLLPIQQLCSYDNYLHTPQEAGSKGKTLHVPFWIMNLALLNSVWTH